MEGKFKNYITDEFEAVMPNVSPAQNTSTKHGFLKTELKNDIV